VKSGAYPQRAMGTRLHDDMNLILERVIR